MINDRKKLEMILNSLRGIAVDLIYRDENKIISKEGCLIIGPARNYAYFKVPMPGPVKKEITLQVPVEKILKLSFCADVAG